MFRVQHLMLIAVRGFLLKMKNTDSFGFGKGCMSKHAAFGMVIVLGLFAVTGICFAGTITLQGNSTWIDSYIDQNNPTTNYGAGTSYYINNNSGGWDEHAVIGIPIPYFNGTVSSANLTVYTVSASSDPSGANNCSLFKLNKGFSETQVTWNKNDSSNNWAAAGGDYNTTAIDRIVVPAATRSGAGNYTFHLVGSSNAVNLTITPNATLWVMLGVALDDDIGFFSSDYTTNASRTPKLDLAYAEGGTTTTTTATTTTTLAQLYVVVNSPSNNFSTTQSSVAVNYTVFGSNQTYNTSLRLNNQVNQTSTGVQNNTAALFNLTNLYAGIYWFNVTAYINSSVWNISQTYNFTVLNTTTTMATTTTSASTTTTLCSLGLGCGSCTGWVYLNSTSGTLQVMDADNNSKYDRVCCGGTVSNYTRY